MPLSVAAFIAPTTHSSLTIAGETLEVDWRPKALDAEMLGQIQGLQRMDDLTVDEQMARLNLAAAMLIKLVAHWDLVEYLEEDGTPGPTIALTPERLSQCSIDLLWAILSALLSESRVGEANGTTSPAPSRAITRTGTPSGSRR